MKNIYLQVNGSWQLFASPTENDFKERNISIGEFARIGEVARIGAEARIGKGASIGEWARIGEGASIGEWARIGEGASIGEFARIGAEARIGARADFTKIHSIYIIGSKHIVNYYGNGKIAIGCHVLTFPEWAERYEDIGKDNNYSEAQIKEYKQYIDLITKFYENK